MYTSCKTMYVQCILYLSFQKERKTMDNYKSRGQQREHLDDQCNEAMDSSTEAGCDTREQQACNNELFQGHEDNSNTEFFYDDEYALQYDANLAEVDMDMLDAVDLNTLLSPLAKRKLRDENSACFVPHMTPSKSDSCLYVLGSSAERGSSQDQSVYSEQEFVSSVELSDLPSEPLFSPLPGHEMTPNVSVDSLGRDTDVSASITTSFNEEKFSYDWVTNKDQYMLCPPRCSSEESYNDTVHGSIHSSVTGTGDERKGERLTWRKMVEHRASSSNDSSGSEKQNIGELSRKNLAKHNLPIPGLEVKTTWKTLNRSSDDDINSDISSKCKSMPELGEHAKLEQEDAPSNGEFLWGRTLVRAVSDGDAAGKTKEYTGSLVEMFQKLHQNQLGFETENEALVTPPESYPGVNSIWSVSDVSVASSGKSCNKSPSSPNFQGKVTWGSLKQATADAATEMSRDRLMQKERGNNDPDNNTMSSSERRIPIMCGSLLKDNFVRKKLGESLQSSLNVTQKDNSTQTSVHESPGHNLMNRSMQTSVKNGFKQTRDAETLISPDTERNMLTAQRLQKKFREKLSDSLFYNKVSLPDLSFLNRQMSFSSSFPQRDQYSNYANFRSGQIQSERSRSQSLRRQRREFSPGMSGSRGSSCASRRSSESLSNNVSTCSSSSSGIDPGSAESSNYRCRCRQFSPNLYDSLGSTDAKSYKQEKQEVQIQKESMCRNWCSRDHGERNNSNNEKSMMASHPIYCKHQIDAKQKCLEYLQLSPTHQPQASRKRSPNPYKYCLNEQFQLVLNEDDTGRQLKPCLRRNPALRERSMSEPFDLSCRSRQVVMRRKQDKHTCNVKKANRRSWPIRAADEQYGHTEPVEGYKFRDSSVNQVAGVPVCQECEHSCADSDVTLTADMESSDSSRTKKSVKFSEHVSYHSPYSSPHQSPNKHPSLPAGILVYILILVTQFVSGPYLSTQSSSSTII